MKKIFKKILVILTLLLIYIYLCNIHNIPDSVVIFEGEEINLKTILGINIDGLNNYETTLTSSNMGDSTPKEKTSYNNKIKLKIFKNFNLKTINVNVIPKTKVIPVGRTIGMKLYTNGIMVVGMAEIEGKNNSRIKPYENTDIEEGDSIISINNKEIHNTNELIDEINNSKGNNIIIKYAKSDEIKETTITPAKYEDEYKIGLWVRDAAAGVGTVTFYEPSTNMFMSLGHGIEDIDTGKIVEIANGELVTANILSIEKGRKDSPGEIRGTISNGTTIGNISKNTQLGVYGDITNKEILGISTNNEIEIANRKEIQKGNAKIICQLDNNAPEEYDIKIEKIYLNNDQNNKSMLIKITDERLIEKTGGIIQGMSGAPIVQNGKFIGAVTNVLVKDPTQGYAVFGDLLIKQMRILDNS